MSVKTGKSKLSKEDLKQALRDQVDLLQINCATYDAGKEIVAKQLAVVLRLLLNQTKQSHSLLGLLDLRGGYFVNTAHDLRPSNVTSEFALTSTALNSATGATYKPKLSNSTQVQSSRKVFSDWWSDAVIKDQQNRTFSRRLLVSAVANTDGGAHVDPELDVAYKELTRDNSLRMYFSLGDDVTQDMGNPVLASIRQIAYETLTTLRKTAPWLNIA